MVFANVITSTFKESEMGQDSGTVTIVMGSRIPAFKGELLNFEGD